MAMPVIHRDITPYDKSAHLLACPPAKKVFWTKFGQASPSRLFQPTDGCAVARRAGEDGLDFFASQFCEPNLLG